MASSGELCGKGRCGVFAGKIVWSTPERLRGKVLTTRRYTNLRLPLPIFTYLSSIDSKKLEKHEDRWHKHRWHCAGIIIIIIIITTIIINH